MTMRYFLLFCTCVVLLISGSSLLCAQRPLLQAGKAAQLRKQMTMLTEGWKIDADGLLGESPTYYSLPQTARGDFPDDDWTYFTVHPVNLWRYTVAGDARWTDYTFSTTVQIEQPAPLRGLRVGEDFFNYQWGREALGTDAGVIVRYQGPDDYYMVRLSSGYGHVELWKTHGGVVRVQPFAFEPKKAYHLAVTAGGNWLLVNIDGKEVIRYYDPVVPLTTGKVGVGVRESRVRFSDLQVQSAPAITDPAPVHTPNFQRRKWVGRDYIFDGDEPIGYFTYLPSGIEMREVKLRPGLMPLLIPFVGMASYDYRPGGEIKVTREGKSFAFTSEQVEKKDGYRCTAQWELQYDPAVGYIWDKQATTEVLKDKALSSWPQLDDPYFYQLVAPATDKLPACRRLPNACIKECTDGGTVAFPAAHHLWTDGCGDPNKSPIRPNGHMVVVIDGWGVACEYPDDNKFSYIGGFCHWGLDLHMSNLPNVVPAKGNKYSGHVRYALWEPERTKQAYAKGVLPVPNRETPAERVANVEPVNHLQKIVPGLTGESVRLWTGNYAVDHTVGHGDHTAMRIDAADIKQRLNGAYGDERPNIWLGPSYWTGPYLAPRYRFGMWVKADKFTGKVVLLANGFNQPGKRKYDEQKAELAIDGKCNWRYVSFEATFPHDLFNWVLRIDPIGTGVIWVDDIEVTPLT